MLRVDGWSMIAKVAWHEHNLFINLLVEQCKMNLNGTNKSYVYAQYVQLSSKSITI